MAENRKDAFEIELKRRTRKELIKHTLPIFICMYAMFFIIFAIAGSETGLGIIGWLASQTPLSIVFIALCIALIPFIWFMSKPDCKKRAYENILKDISKKSVERIMTPGEPIKVRLNKSKVGFGDFVLDLQNDEEAELYAVLGEKDNLISIYAILTGKVKKYNLEVVTKGEFTDSYEFVDQSEN